MDKQSGSRSQLTVRQVGKHLRLVFSGFLIGTANLIPGVSGGTMALLLGIYERLIESIRALTDAPFLKALARLKVRQALGQLPWAFLLAVGGGAVLAVFSLPYLLEWLLATVPRQLEGFFFGLIAASILAVGKRVQRWNVLLALMVIVGAVGTYMLVGLVPASTPESPLLLFLAAVVAIGAMVLPGVSGAYVLILLGQYDYALAAVTERNFLRIALILLGAGVGLVTFARFLSWLFRRQRDLTLAVLTGMVLGSLRKLWPWKETLPNDLSRNILPSAWTWEVTTALALALGGFLLVVLLDRQRPVKTARLLIATNNPGKLREYRAILGDLPLELVSPADLGLEIEVEETGATYEENARLKAVAFAQASGLLTLADDSGLEVDALGGAPGMHSRRQEGADDTERYRLLLERLRGVPPAERGARFRCVIVIATPTGETHTCEDICPGVIIDAPRGEGGFGYDPIFFLPELGRTMAELSPEEKNRHSHRGRAGRQAGAILGKIAR